MLLLTQVLACAGAELCSLCSTVEARSFQHFELWVQHSNATLMDAHIISHADHLHPQYVS